jgi:VanZ family protein
MKNPLRWIIVLLWLLMIGYFSHQPFQQQDIAPYIMAHPRLIHLVQQMPAIEFSYNNSPINSHTNTVQFVQFIVRKLMHLTIYGLFGLSLLLALPSSSKVRFRHWTLAALIVLGTAALDELNQYMSTTRTGCKEDIAMDFFGFLLFSCLWAVFRWRQRRA